MSLKIGIVGLPNVGKSTLFQALTKKQVDTSNYPFATIDPNVGVVAVPDERLQKLADLSHSKKIVPASIEFTDIAGLVKGAHEGEGLGNKFLSHIREVDAIVEVIRVFNDESVHHVSGSVDPDRDAGIILTELILADLSTVEKGILRSEKEARGGKVDEKKKLEFYQLLFKALSSEQLASSVEFPREDDILAHAYQELQLLTAKPFIFLFNTQNPDDERIKDLIKKYGSEHSLALNIKLEDEVGQLGEDAGDLTDLSNIDQLIAKAYEALGLISFLTTGEDETRAWPIPRDASAPRAGRAIHSDFEEKFIRAEVISYENLIKAGSYAKARELGLLQIKGKDYIVQDGDVIEFRI